MTWLFIRTRPNPEWTFEQSLDYLNDPTVHPNVRGIAAATIGFRGTAAAALALAPRVDDDEEIVRELACVHLRRLVEWSIIRRELGDRITTVEAHLRRCEPDSYLDPFRFRARTALGDGSVLHEPAFRSVDRVTRIACHGMLGGEQSVAELRHEVETPRFGYDLLAALFLARNGDGHGMDNLRRQFKSHFAANRHRLGSATFALANLGDPLGYEAIVTELNEETLPRARWDIDVFLTRFPLRRETTSFEIVNWVEAEMARRVP